MMEERTDSEGLATAEPIAHGDADHGFIVEHHADGQHLTFSSTKASPEAAVDEAKSAWSDGDGGVGSGHQDPSASTARISRDELDDLLGEIRTHFEGELTEVRSALADREKSLSDLQSEHGKLAERCDFFDARLEETEVKVETLDRARLGKSKASTDTGSAG